MESEHGGVANQDFQNFLNCQRFVADSGWDSSVQRCPGSLSKHISPTTPPKPPESAGTYIEEKGLHTSRVFRTPLNSQS